MVEKGNSIIRMNGWEDELNTDHLSEAAGRYLRGKMDTEDAVNDPQYSAIRYSAGEMISGYIKDRDSDVARFVRNSISGPDDMIQASRDMKQQKLNEITADWVREWHEKKQSIGKPGSEIKEIYDFVKASIETKPETEKSDVKKKISYKTLFAVLSTAAVLGLFLLVKSLTPTSPVKIYDSYYTPFAAMSSVTRGTNTATTFDAAVAAYKNSRYSEAAVVFDGLVKSDPASGSSEFFLGLSQLALADYTMALKHLETVAAKQGEYNKEARWYLGLAYLKVSEKDKAAACFRELASSDGYYRERSEEILRLLK